MTVRYRDVGGTSCLLQWLRRSILRNSFYSTRSHILGESNLTSLLRLEQSANQLSATEFFFRNQKITETFQKFLVSSSLRSKRRECDGAEQRTCAALPDNCLPGDLDLICARTHTHTHTWCSPHGPVNLLEIWRKLQTLLASDKPQRSFPYSQQTITGPHLEHDSVHTLYPISFTFTLILPYYRRLGVPCSLFPMRSLLNACYMLRPSHPVWHD